MDADILISGGGVAGPLVALGVAGAAAAYYYMYLM